MILISLEKMKYLLSLPTQKIALQPGSWISLSQRSLSAPRVSAEFSPEVPHRAINPEPFGMSTSRYRAAFFFAVGNTPVAPDVRAWAVFGFESAPWVG